MTANKHAPFTRETERRTRRWFPWNLLRPGRGTAKFTRKPTDESAPKPIRIGLALSSGGAKGLAHVGVIQVLEENDIHIDAIAGCSMGAYVGSLWAAGFNGQQMAELAAELDTNRDMLKLVDPIFPPRRGFIHGDKVEDWLARSLKDASFDQLEKPLYVVATELDGFARKVFHQGDVVSAVRASLSIPGILEPAVRDGVEYVDGGVSDPLPVDVLKDRGIDAVIAVNVIPSIEDLKNCRLKAQVIQKNKRWWQQPASWLNQKLNYFAKGNLLDILRGAAMGSQIRLLEECSKRADVLLCPIVCDSSWHNYTNYEEYIQTGREIATAKLPEIKALIAACDHSKTLNAK